MDVPSRMDFNFDPAQTVEPIRIFGLVLQSDGHFVDSGVDAIEREMDFLFDIFSNHQLVLDIFRFDFNFHGG